MAADAVAWALERLGPGARVVATARGEEADLWHLRSPAADAWLKRHRHGAKAAREQAIYERLTPTLGDRIPPLLGADGHGALLLGACPGRPATAIAPADRRDLWASAGAFLRRLHAVEIADDDPVPLAEAYARRFARWHARARPHVPEALHAEVAARFDPAVFAGASRRLCHRDFRPANWHVGPDPAQLWVFDFGQSRPDDPLVDLVKILAEASDDEPTLAALQIGLHRELSDAELARLTALRLLHALATAAWTATHDRSAHAAALDSLQTLVRGAARANDGLRGRP